MSEIKYHIRVLIYFYIYTKIVPNSGRVKSSISLSTLTCISLRYLLSNKVPFPIEFFVIMHQKLVLSTTPYLEYSFASVSRSTT